MEHSNGHSTQSAPTLPPAELASALSAAQQRALEQRLAVEELLAEARSLEERLATEALAAQAAAERALAREHAAAALAAAQFEREAIVTVEAAATQVAELAQRRAGAEDSVAQWRVSYESAARMVADCEERLVAARAELERALQAQAAADAQRIDLIAAQAAADDRTAAASEQLAEHRAARQRAENASAQAEERARALIGREDGDITPSLEPVEQLRLLEARIALRAEAAKRAADRRASDLARNHVVH